MLTCAEISTADMPVKTPVTDKSMGTVILKHDQIGEPVNREYIIQDSSASFMVPMGLNVLVMPLTHPFSLRSYS
jgi:hypothetical protein